jgi:hypothetical protein
LKDYWYQHPTTDLQKHVRTKMINLKLIVSLFAMFLPRPIPSLPDRADGYRGSNELAKQWRADFKKISDEAWQNIKQFFCRLGITDEKKFTSGAKFRKLLYEMEDGDRLWPNGVDHDDCYLCKVSAQYKWTIKSKAVILKDKETNKAASEKRIRTMAANKAARAAEVNTVSQSPSGDTADQSV